MALHFSGVLVASVLLPVTCVYELQIIFSMNSSGPVQAQVRIKPLQMALRTNFCIFGSDTEYFLEKSVFNIF